MRRWGLVAIVPLLTFCALAVSTRAAQRTKGDAPVTGQAVPRDDNRSRETEDAKRAEEAQEKRDREKEEKERRDQAERRDHEERARREARRSPEPRRPVSGRVVFVGGYFLDPFLLPRPWWSPTVYPYRWGPDFAGRAEMRVIATPKDAAVYVDGYYAGIVDDFDGLLQALPLLPGGHTISLYREGYLTLRRSVYLSPGAHFRLREQMQRLPPGARSEVPDVAVTLPPPPPGTYIPRQAPPREAPVFPPSTRTATVGFGMLSVNVHPPDAVVTIDGDVWVTTHPGVFIVHLAAGRHIVTVTGPTHRPFSAEVDIPEGDTSELNVSLPPLDAR